MIFRIKLNQAMTLIADAKKPGLELEGHQVKLTAAYAEDNRKEFSAYEQLLMDAIEGDRTHFLRFDEVEWTWRLPDPVLKAWKKGHTNTYPTGSEGPATQDRLLSKGHHWRSVRLVAGEED